MPALRILSLATLSAVLLSAAANGLAPLPPPLNISIVAEDDSPVELLKGTTAVWGSSADISMRPGREVNLDLEYDPSNELVSMKLEYRNRSDRPVKSVDIAWVRIDASGKQFGFTGAKYVVGNGRLKPGKQTSGEVRNLIPLATRELKVIVIGVDFSDGSSWKRPQVSQSAATPKRQQ